MRNYIPKRSIEYNSNRVSKLIAQYSKCAVLGEELGIIGESHCQHIILPRKIAIPSYYCKGYDTPTYPSKR